MDLTSELVTEIQVFKWKALTSAMVRNTLSALMQYAAVLGTDHVNKRSEASYDIVRTKNIDNVLHDAILKRVSH